MSYAKRFYRKKLTSHGFIYLGGEEYEITLSNISITGMLAELTTQEPENKVVELFDTIKTKPLADVYLHEMRLAGEVEIVRSDIIDGHLYLAMEFRTIEHDIDNLFYERQVYRKSLSAPGLIILNGERCHFMTVNVSVDGLMIRLPQHVLVDEGTVAAFDFKRLDMLGEVKVVWVKHQDDETLMGLEYIYLEKTFVKGVPRFARPRSTNV
jgi:hypothetical protein